MPARDEGGEVATRPPLALIAPTQRGEFGSFRERERARERRVFAAAKLVCLSIAFRGYGRLVGVAGSNCRRMCSLNGTFRILIK